MVQISVSVMILGAVIAAINDFTFNFIGYFAVLINNLSSALNGVYTKKKIETKELGIFGLMFYNALVMTIPAILLTSYQGDFNNALNYSGWSDYYSTMCFMASCVLGIVLVYSTMLCTKYNTALATSIIGCLKTTAIKYQPLPDYMPAGNPYLA
ncbi:uncharacterized protein TRIADDRAFT_57887 [Trichoplax adhaerens]|uniref:Sugar phosphate transporter domain-containing protein n=1 Tax=Trichoplax adhaerens TaxID=10228 RepID=B3S1U4_TRIAD|nr:hypothetical protein TRIADDRAFT_57887 [Trichoplax adhaerens]EDV23354.1 hypothetical protein TRIADDRAFT_57887 [Trichoplax adhaerens]|eukprot:XP_002114264.1 hypothetical protein TRIADDRAFT_57887 [Trichoplax adhaerens]